MPGQRRLRRPERPGEGPERGLADGGSGYALGGLLLPAGFNASFTGAAAGAAAGAFRDGTAAVGRFGDALFWALLYGRMMRGNPIGSASHFAPQTSKLEFLPPGGSYDKG